MGLGRFGHVLRNSSSSSRADRLIDAGLWLHRSAPPPVKAETLVGEEIAEPLFESWQRPTTRWVGSPLHSSAPMDWPRESAQWAEEEQRFFQEASVPALEEPVAFKKEWRPRWHLSVWLLAALGVLLGLGGLWALKTSSLSVPFPKAAAPAPAVESSAPLPLPLTHEVSPATVAPLQTTEQQEVTPRSSVEAVDVARVLAGTPVGESEAPSATVRPLAKGGAAAHSKKLLNPATPKRPQHRWTRDDVMDPYAN